MHARKPPYLPGAEIRRQFLHFFADHGHLIVPSASLLPDDATLMFTNAGMVQFKDVFTGAERRSYTRATTAQKCLRVSGKHNDLEEVGQTPRHHTFFEMLGNFSFGDYFKEEAIRLAWELLTVKWRIPAERLWVTVHDNDDEAWDIWARLIGVPEARIQRLGDKDNFWSMGDVGPCGPCTEIHYDLGPEMGDSLAGPAGGGNRYMEIWNLVFMQFQRFADGTMTPLPRPSVDTGGGLERIACVLQGVLTNYDTDLLRDLIEDAARVTGVATDGSPEHVMALRVLADHCRACAFLVADGVIPANEGRGYELRRIARRAIRFGVKLGVGAEPFFHHLTDCVVERFGEAYPELHERRPFIREVIRGEEVRFSETRDKGLQLLERELERIGAETMLHGDVVFRLHDTYGFPPDLTRLIAAERGVGADLDGYHARMEHQKALGRAAWRGSGTEGIAETWLRLANEGLRSEFRGYDALEAESQVIAILRDGAVVPRLEAGERGDVLTRVTPFYPEGGGQLGDIGAIRGGSAVFAVTDTRKPAEGIIVHSGTLAGAALEIGATVTLAVDADARGGARRNHTATHLLHAALRRVLGEHVMQKGSLVGPNRLRFDFSHYKAVEAAELRRIEDLVYAEILRNEPVVLEESSQEEARRRGAMAFFGEKYGDRVRVIRVGDFSMELCGGTHASRTGDIGLFRIVSEAGVAAGVRRIEALTGLGAMEATRAIEAAAEAGASELRTPPDQLPVAIRKLVEENRALRKQIEDRERQSALTASDQFLSRVRTVGDVKVLAAETSGDPNTMRDQADKLRSQLGSGVVVLGIKVGDKARLLVAVTEDLAGKRVDAGKLVAALAPHIGGKGGGRPDFAQAGGDNAGGIAAAVEAAAAAVGRMIGA